MRNLHYLAVMIASIFVIGNCFGSELPALNFQPPELPGSQSLIQSANLYTAFDSTDLSSPSQYADVIVEKISNRLANKANTKQDFSGCIREQIAPEVSSDFAVTSVRSFDVFVPIAGIVAERKLIEVDLSTKMQSIVNSGTRVTCSCKREAGVQNAPD